MKIFISNNLPKNFLELSHDLICVVSFEGYFQYVNPVWEKQLGYTEKELLSKPFLDFIYPDDQEKTNREISNLSKGKSKISFDNRCLHKDGSEKYISWKAIPEKNEKSFYAIGRDISESQFNEQKIYEREIVKQQQVANNYLNIVGSIILALNRKGEITLLNKKGHSILGYEEGELIGKDWFDTCLPKGIARNVKEYFKELTEGKVEEQEIYENEVIRKNGQRRIVKWFNTLVKDELGNICGLLSSGEDITEQKQTKKALKESEERLRLIIEGSNDAPWDWDIANKKIYYSPQWWSQIGYMPDELPVYENLWYELLHPEDRENVDDILDKARKTDMQSYQIEFRLQHKDGHYVPVLSRGLFMRDNKGNITRVTGTNMDLSERKKTEEALQNSEELLRVTLANISDPVFITDDSGKFYYICPNISNSLGFSLEEIEKKGNISEFLGDTLFSLEELRKEGELINREHSLPDKSGKYHDFLINIKQVNIGWGTILFTFHEITERKFAEKEISETKQFYADIIEGVQDGIWVANENDIIYFANLGMEKITGIPREKMLDNSVYGDFLEGTTGEILTFYKQAKKEKKPIWYDIKFKTPAGKDTWQNGWLIPQYENDVLKGIICTIRDVTERKQVQEKLEKNEQLFRFLAENAKDIIYRMSIPDATYEYVSPAALELFGYAPKEFYDTPLLIEKMIHPDWDEYFKNEWQNLLDGNVSPYYEYQIIHKSGKVKWLNQRNTLVKNEKGMPIAIEGVVTDITERKQMEEVLVENQKRYEKAQAIGHVGNWEYSPETDFFWGSDETKRIYGFELDREQFSVEKVENCIPERERVHQALIDLIEHNKKYDLFFDIITYDKGVRKTIHSIAEIERDAQSNIKKITGLISDITKSKQAEYDLIEAKEKAEEKAAELKKQQALFETMFNTIKEGVVIANTKREIILANNGLHATFGYKPIEVIGKETKILYADTDKFEETGSSVFNKDADNKDKQYLTYYKRKNNRIFPGETFGAKLYDDKNVWIGNIAIIRDVSERERFITELKNAKEKAEESDRLKSAFLANMSHEIRTPMNGILGFTSLLKKPELSGEKKQQYIEIIEESGARMLNTINDIIDIAKIESGQVQVAFSEINVNEQMDELFEFFLPEAAKKNIQLSISHRIPGQQTIIKSDKEKLNSVLINLIKNAIKYTHAGSIDFGCILKEKSNRSELEFYIKDTGVGIPAKKQKAIFDRFVQADIKDSHVYEGSGLGLAISKAYIEKLRGKIWVESEEGAGSLFCFTVPYHKVDNEILIKNVENLNEVQSPKRKLKILIVEDEAISLNYLSVIFEESANEILIAKTGFEAVELCYDNPDINLVLMDIKIPGIDGYEATRRIREFNKDVFILAQTAFAQIGDREKCIEAGCNSYIGKPIKEEKLLKIITNHF